MTDSSDRKAISKLYPQAEPQARWKNNPTVIPKPQNPPRMQSGVNPFGKVPSRQPANGQRSSASVGNPTSKQTLTGAIRRGGKEPPQKKRKVSHGEGFGGSPLMSNILKDQSEVIIVDDDEDQATRASKYLFPSAEAHRNNNRRGIHPNGKNTAALDKYSSMPTPPGPVDLTQEDDEVEDEIEDFSDSALEQPDPRSESRPTSHHSVKALVKVFEGKADPLHASPPRLDLRTVVPGPKGKSRMFQSQFNPMRSNPPATRAAGPSNISRGLDPIATSSSFKPSPRPPPKSLTVKDALIDAESYVGSPDAHLYVTCDTRKGLSFVRRQNNSGQPPQVVYSVPSMGIPEMKVKYATPVIQFGNTSAKPELVTIRFQDADPSWSTSEFDKLTTYLRGVGAPVSYVSNGSALWAVAESHKVGFLAECSPPPEVIPEPAKSGRMQELQAIEDRKRKSLSSDSLPSTKRTPKDVFESKRQESQAQSASAGPAVPSTALPSNPPKNPPRDNKKDRSEPETVPRKSPRFSTTNKKDDGDEIILVYPAGAPGAVTITQSDIARVKSEQYLNDTIIEFAMKHWLNNLQQENPELASQVHVFSSFFYKKLNSKRDIKQAYEHVRKWTSKVDIFKKKYIIVPINEHYHWYLAIIYEPEHILSQTAPDKKPERKATRQTTKAVEDELSDALAQSAEDANLPAEVDDEKISIDVEEDKTLQGEDEAQDELLEHPQTSSEGEVERDLSGFEDSVRIEDPEPEHEGEDPLPAEGGARSPSPATLSYVSENAMQVSKSREASPMAFDSEEKMPSRQRSGSSASSNVNMSDPDELLLQSGDQPVELSEENVAMLDDLGPQPEPGAEAEPGSPIAVSEEASASHGGPIPAARFYQSAKKKGKGKQKGKLPTRSVSKEDADTQDFIMDVDRKPQTVIFTLDSLGNSHPAPIKRLAAYLQCEAEDKKGIPKAGLAAGKQASVPIQTNFVDCGLYLVHFAKTFISDPVKYFNLSMAPKAKLHNQDAKESWKSSEVDTMRKDLASTIGALSTEWKKTRPVKLEQEDDGSDDDIAILSQKPAESKSAASKKGKKPKKGAAGKKKAVEEEEVVEEEADIPEVLETTGKALRMR